MIGIRGLCRNIRDGRKREKRAQPLVRMPFSSCVFCCFSWTSSGHHVPQLYATRRDGQLALCVINAPTHNIEASEIQESQGTWPAFGMLWRIVEVSLYPFLGCEHAPAVLTCCRVNGRSMLGYQRENADVVT